MTAATNLALAAEIAAAVLIAEGVTEQMRLAGLTHGQTVLAGKLRAMSPENRDLLVPTTTRPILLPKELP